MSELSLAEPSGRVVVVTGAAGAVGRLVCKLLDERGAVVVAVGSNASHLETVEGTAHFECDLSDESAVDELASVVRAQFGRVDGVLHLVGGWRGGNNPEDFEWLESRLLTTLRYVSLAFADDLATSSAGRFAIVSSTGVDAPTWSNANYTTLKAAAEVWVQSLAAHWKKNAHSAAAVTFAVRAIGNLKGHTTVDDLAEHLAALWNASTHSINGARIDLAP
ncbi:SDR family oxidoreductase [soil metagenome]